MSLYTSLPEGSIRLLRILPPSNDQRGIQCQLFTCALLNSGNSHAYDALSYVWGPISNERHIYVNNHKLAIRDNLYAALSQLQDSSLERIVWIDAICINQSDNDEKAQQVQSMAKIYAKASRVIVWLGEEADKSSQALSLILYKAEDHDNLFLMSESDHLAIMKLLERPWFERIWVLQEVAAARHILIKCGSEEINGHVFCSGLNMVKFSYQANPTLAGTIPQIAYLIRGADFRPRYQSAETDRFSARILPLGQLVDMYHTRKATDPLDRIYALLGMSSDDPIASGLTVDYGAKWREVFHKCVELTLPDQMLVRTWDDKEVAVIEGNGYMLGVVSLVERDRARDDKQHVEINWQKSLHFDHVEGEYARFTLHVSAKEVQVGDAVCLLDGALDPTIIRPGPGFFTVIMIAAPLMGSLPKWTTGINTYPNHLLLIWDWDASSGADRDYESLLNSRVAKCPNAGCLCQDNFSKAIQLWEFGVSLNAINSIQRAGIALQHAIEAYEAGIAARKVAGTGADHCPGSDAVDARLQMMSDVLETGKTLLLKEKYEKRGQTPLEWAIEEGHEAVVKLLLDWGAAVDITNHKGQTQLHVSTSNGQRAMVQLLLDGGADLHATDQDGQAPLHIAVREGHEAIAELLLDKGAAIDGLSQDYETPLHIATREGHEPIVELLLDKGADIDSINLDGQSPLFWAAWNGHEALVKLLLDRGAAIPIDRYNEKSIPAISAAYRADAMPLNAAAMKGHEKVARLLLDKGTCIDAGNIGGDTPLYLAVLNGHEALVELLLERRADVEGINNRAPLWEAARRGDERIVKLLLDGGAYIHKRGWSINTPLEVAVQSGHYRVVKLLLERGAIVDGEYSKALDLAVSLGHEAVLRVLLVNGASADARHLPGTTLLHLAASEGHKGVAELLLDSGAPIDAEGEYAETPLLKAASNGHKAVAELLLDRGAAIDAKDRDGLGVLQRAAWNGHKVMVELLLDRGAAIDARDENLELALFYAASGGHEIMAEFLLDMGAADAKDEMGNRLLQDAVMRNDEAIVALLLDRGAAVEAENIEGNTILQQAVSQGYETMVKLLLDRGATVNVKDKKGGTALQKAAFNGNKTIVELLLDRGAAIDAKDKDGLGALQRAAWNGHEVIVELLLDRGAAIDTEDGNGQTVQQLSAAWGYNEVVQKLLLSRGAKR